MVINPLMCTKTPLFAEFQMTLDAEMKRLQSKRLGSNYKQAEPISEEEEDLLWAMELLGNHNPQALLNTMVFMTGLYFALRSGKEHRELRYNERPDHLYTEDSPTNHPGGLRGQHEYMLNIMQIQTTLSGALSGSIRNI